MNCPHCQSEQVVKAGTRRLKSGAARQLYRCNDCWRRFSSRERHRKRTPGKAILRALVLVCRGCNYDEAALALEREFGVRRSRACISRWVTERTLPWLEIHHQLTSSAGPVVRSHLFTHDGLNYLYQVHQAKLVFAHKFPGLIRYLTTLPNWLDHSLFSRAQHCSQLRLMKNPGVRKYQGALISRMTAEAVPLAATNHQRHSVVEEYLLNGDRNTMACEVPVYYRLPAIGLVAGHIDLVQVSADGVQLLDYKPNASRERADKVVTQLTLYAQALSRRAGVPLDAIRCGYFDERDAYFFRPAKAFPRVADSTTSASEFELYLPDASHRATQPKTSPATQRTSVPSQVPSLQNNPYNLPLTPIPYHAMQPLLRSHP